MKSGKNTTIDAGLDTLVKGGRKVAIESNGPAELTSQKLAVQAGDEPTAEARRILLKAGAASVQMKLDGGMTVDGKDVNFKASGDLVMKGSKVKQN